MDYEIPNTLNKKTVIPNIEVDICDACSEKFFGYEAAVRLGPMDKRYNEI